MLIAPVSGFALRDLDKCVVCVPKLCVLIRKIFTNYTEMPTILFLKIGNVRKLFYNFLLNIYAFYLDVNMIIFFELQP